MKIGILGTGMVGKTIGSKLVSIGHEVKMGSRSATNESATTWATEAGANASVGTFADAAAYGEVIFLCVGGDYALSVVESAGPPSFANKIVLDLCNPLDFSAGFPPTLSVAGRDSIGERVQAALPDAFVVKTLNTMNCSIMVAPEKLAEATEVFVSGNDADAKAKVIGYLTNWFGWEAPVDFGDITMARGTEAWLMMWVRLYGALGTGDFNIKIVGAEG